MPERSIDAPLEGINVTHAEREGLLNKDFTRHDEPNDGAPSGARTLDQRIKSPLLYQLS